MHEEYGGALIKDLGQLASDL
jgi:septal ring factor EnvC (AmiA/AmiB activator)